MPLDKNFGDVDASQVFTGGPNQTAVAETFVNALVEGKPLADDGSLYSTVQGAENAASGWVFVPPGTFNESVTIDTSGLTIVGSGYDTLIDGASVGHAIHATVDDVVIKSLRVRTDSSTNLDGIRFAGGTDPSRCKAINVWATNAGDEGINTRGFKSIIARCYSTGDSHGIQLQEGRDSEHICINNIIDNPGVNGINVAADNCVCANNIVTGAGKNGINSQGCDDTIVIGNRVHNSTEIGIEGLQNADVIYANNRVSGSGTSDIDVGGTTNAVTDANLTGSAN